MTDVLRPRRRRKEFLQFSALVAAVAGEVDREAIDAVEATLSAHGFAVTVDEMGSGADAERVCARAATSFDALFTLGGLRSGGEEDIADIVRDELDDELPGLAELVRRTQYDAGHTLSVFESAACGRIDAAVVLTLPDRLEGVLPVLEVVVPVLVQMLDDTDPRPPAVTDPMDRGFLTRPPDADDAVPLPENENRPDAQILPIRRPVEGPDDTTV